MNGISIKRFFENFYPLDLAYEWDNVGLQVGTLNKEITGVLLTLDVTKEIVAEALEKNCNLIVAHHPLIFTPLKSILSDTYKGQLFETLIKHNIAVYVSHTNYDLGHSGMNTVLASKLALENQAVLEMVSETHGIGRIGKLKEKLPLQEAVNYVKEALAIDHGRLITNKTNKTVETIAISGGSGASHMFEAKRKGADLYITGDVSYHQAHDMLQMGLTALDIGHYAEKHFAKALKRELIEYGIEFPIYESEIDLDPFTFV